MGISAEEDKTRDGSSSPASASTNRPSTATGVLGATAVGASGALGLQWLAGALVPWAMSTFGTVVAGTGTIHAAGGVAATLQGISAASSGPVGVVGAAVGSVAYNCLPTRSGTQGDVEGSHGELSGDNNKKSCEPTARL